VVPGDLQDFTIELYAVAGEVGGGDLLHSGIEGGVGGFGEGACPGECQGKDRKDRKDCKDLNDSGAALARGA
jgi:hypothetical protein